MDVSPRAASKELVAAAAAGGVGGLGARSGHGGETKGPMREGLQSDGGEAMWGGRMGGGGHIARGIGRA